jgi:hypothetical protein
MGHLNYQMSPLSHEDELRNKMNSMDIYSLEEAPITFAPTCKSIVPSYCDRILYNTYGAISALRSLFYGQFETNLSEENKGVLGYFEFA